MVDTNILPHAVNRDSPHCRSACRALEDLANGRRVWALSWTVIYEFLRVATHPRVFPQPLEAAEAWTFLRELLARPACLMLVETAQHSEQFARCLKQTPRLRGTSCMTCIPPS